MSPCKRLALWLILGLLIGCSSKKSPTPTLVPTLTPPPATATPSPSPTPTETPTPTPTPIPLAALVNDQPILLADFERERDRAGDASTPHQVLDAMILSVLMEQAAEAAGITVSDEELDAFVQADVDSRGREAFDAWLAANGMTEEEYRAIRRKELLAERVQMQIPDDLPASAPHVHARHILVATQEEAETVLAQLQDGADFATLAEAKSLDVSTRERGGDLGFFPRGVLLAPELEEAAFSLAPGQISGVVHSQLLGYHIIQVLERQEDRPIDELNLEAIKFNGRETIRLWRERLWADAAIERYVDVEP